MVSAFAKVIVTATPSVLRASSANREMDTLRSVDALAEARRTGTTVSVPFQKARPASEHYRELVLLDLEL